ncbi:MFS transporter [Parabacteroides sp. Marseille-P3160]|uniref:MFS transporter n=1 Tax=Parabacteroides sp. Marseille-P3160 TaxID=1917887 RepID=UPI0009BA3C05|nr:MFS transporter [Parabacteroides sp. Marseille-P3160]
MNNAQSEENSNAVLFVICMAAFLVPFSSSALNLALPMINRDLSLNAAASGWVPTVYLLSTAIFQIPFARIADIFGRRKIFMLGIAIFTAFSVMSGFATHGAELIVYRFFCGIGSAMVFSTNMALLTASVPPRKRGWALGINTAVVYFSLSAGPFLGGILTQYIGWESIFFITALVSAIVYLSSFKFLKKDKENKKIPFDYVGASLYAFGLFALIYGFSGLPKLLNFILVFIGILILYVMVLYEKRQDKPVFDVILFMKNRIFTYSSFSALINYSATTSIVFLMSFYFQEVRGLTPRDAGLILIISSLVQAVVSLQSGRLSDKVPASKLATLGMLIISIGLILLCFIGETTSYISILLILILIGAGFGTFSSPNMNVIMSSVEKKDYGLASATTGTMRLTGQAFSMGIAMMAISFTVGNVQITKAVQHEFMAGMRICFIVCSALCLLGVYASSIRNKKGEKN